MEIIEALKQKLNSGISLAVCFKDGLIAEYHGSGIKQLLTAVISNDFTDAVCADKIVGKAAALLFAYGKLKYVYAETISQAATEVFAKHNIPYGYKTLVPFIQNRDGNGKCPMENICANTDKPEEAVKLFRGVMGI